MTRKVSIFNRLLVTFAVAAFFVVNTLAQGDGLQREREEVSQAGTGMWMTMGFLALMGLGAAAYFWWRSKKGANKVEYNYKNRYANYYNEGSGEDETVDAEKELEWLRKARGDSAKAKSESSKKKDNRIGFSTKKTGTADGDLALETKVFQEKMRKLQYSQLPINSFSQLAPAKRYTPLPDSDDPALISAIEQASDEYEEDEAVRGIALKVLAAFRNHNAVEALSEMALYDLSANLRSKAVGFLAEYDHESVFEPILMACADPTREVRAAAARGLFSLGFDRAHAWKRLIEANDTFRLTQAARAAIASDIVSRSFERLIHEDTKVAYEAFALVALLIKAGETKEIFEAIENHKDERVKFALLHVLKVQTDERTMDELTRLALAMKRKPEMLERVKDTMTAIQASVQQEAWQAS
jgi:hypothetical protein